MFCLLLIAVYLSFPIDKNQQQQISQYQELFIQMLNEPAGEVGDVPEVGDLGAAVEEGAPVNYIQVTPQEKEAIERVRGAKDLSMHCLGHKMASTDKKTS